MIHELCPYPWAAFQVLNTRGDVFPCCWSHTCIGNIYETAAWDIWSGESAVQLRSDLVAGRDRFHCPPYCPYRCATIKHSIDYVLESACRHTGEIGRNAISIIKTLSDRNPRVLTPPLVVRVYPTNECGIRCHMCTTWRERPKVDGGIPECMSSFLPSIAVLEAIGGEAVLSPRFIEEAKNLANTYPDLKFATTTNGKYIAKALCGGILPPPQRWEWIGLSFDGVSDQVLATMRNGITCREIREALTELLSWADGRFWVQVLTVITRTNCHEIQDIVKYVEPMSKAFRKVRMAVTLIRGRWPGLSDFSRYECKYIESLCRNIEEQYPFVCNTSAVRVGVNEVMRGHFGL